MLDAMKDKFFGLVLPITFGGKTDQFDSHSAMHVHDVVHPTTAAAVSRVVDDDSVCSIKHHAALPCLPTASPHHLSPGEKCAVPFRLVCISDTHLKHREMRHLPGGDVLVHAGDILLCNRLFSLKHSVELLKDFNLWLGEQPHPIKIVVAGNHDKAIEQLGANQVRSILSNATYLEYDEVVLQHPRHPGALPLRIFGAPFSRGASNNKAFQFQHIKRQPFPEHRLPARFLQPEAAAAVSSSTAGPTNCAHHPLVDVFVTHDYVPPVVPRAAGKLASVHVGGHIHGRFGARYVRDHCGGNILSVVACSLDGRYKLANPPVVVDVTPHSPSGVACGVGE